MEAPARTAGQGAGTDAGPGTDGGPTDGGPVGTPDAGSPDGGVDGGTGFTAILWRPLAARPEGTSEALGALVGGKLYTFGGFDWFKSCCTPTRHAFVYDPATDGWSQLADMPEGVSHAGTTTDGTDIFWAGGFVEDGPRTFQIFGTVHVWRYRVASNTYEAMPPLPEARGAGALEYLDGKLHFFGGESLGQGFDTPEHWVLDLAGRGHDLDGRRAAPACTQPPRLHGVRGEDLRHRRAARARRGAGGCA